MATSRSVQQAKAKVSQRTVRAKRIAVKNGQALARKGRQAAQASVKQARKVTKAAEKQVSTGNTTAHAKARNAGAAIGRIIGRAQGLGRKLVNKAKQKLT